MRSALLVLVYYYACQCCQAFVVPVSGNQKSDKPTEHRLPSAIIIGVKKGGTRALLEYLRLNPLIRAPGPEVHFFDRYFHRGLDWYRRQMPTSSAEQLTIEKTPRYLITKAAPERVHSMHPRVKLIVVVRNPVTRAISDYAQTSSKRVDMPAFEAMAFNGSQINTSWGAVKIGIYERHVRRWLQYFPLAQMHFVSGERLITHPADTVREVERFLGLDPTVTAANFDMYGGEKGFPCVIKQPGTGQQPHCLGKTKGRSHPHIRPELIQSLEQFYAPYNKKFYSLIGRDFGW